MKPGGAMRAAAVAAVLLAACGSDRAAAPTTTTSAPTTTTTRPASGSASASSSTPEAVTLDETTHVVYVLHTSDGVTVRYTIPAPSNHALVERIERFHRGAGETRPLRMALAEIDNRSNTDFETSDIVVTQADGDKVHFYEAWLLVGNWRRQVPRESDSPLYMESFDLDNELLARGIVKPGATSVTVLAAEDFVESVRSVTARDRSGDMIPITREQ